MNGNHHKVEAFHSRLTGKKRIIFDGRIMIKKTELSCLFAYSFYTNENSYCQILQEEEKNKFELIIDNITFSKLLEIQSLI